MQETAGLRIPLTTGVAGAVATSGRQIVIDDAYSDPRFDPSMDQTWNHRTKSMLCMPIFDAERTVIGVMQAR